MNIGNLFLFFFDFLLSNFTCHKSDLILSDFLVCFKTIELTFQYLKICVMQILEEDGEHFSERHAPNIWPNDQTDLEFFLYAPRIFYSGSFSYLKQINIVCIFYCFIRLCLFNTRCFYSLFTYVYSFCCL